MFRSKHVFSHLARSSLTRGAALAVVGCAAAVAANGLSSSLSLSHSLSAQHIMPSTPLQRMLLPTVHCEEEATPSPSPAVQPEEEKKNKDHTAETHTEGESAENDAVESDAELIHVEEDADSAAEAAWEAEKEQCAFCRHFMLSPCRAQFKHWSKCVDQAKATEKDFVKGCVHYTRALMDCTDRESAYFAATRPDEGDDVQDKEKEKDSEKEKETKSE